ncbi:hypothetical protein TYRP_013473 [Tyrophagus putrescentiae]|nr:hypothetical protein TYRP_013473 [Tyrophagus putrescentiae]
MTKLSFQDGILEKYHALIDPSGTIPDHELPDVIEYTVANHEIPYYATNIFPDIKKVVADIYAFTHTYDVNGKKTAYIFAEFDEMDKIRCTFKWFETMSNMHQLNLAWKINFISLRTLYQFLLSHIPVTNLDDSDAFSAFKKGSLYDYTDLCDFHLYLKDCRFCAISQAFIYCYILSEHFSKPFGVAPLGRVTFTGSFLKYEKDL